MNLGIFQHNEKAVGSNEQEVNDAQSNYFFNLGAKFSFAFFC